MFSWQRSFKPAQKCEWSTDSFGVHKWLTKSLFTMWWKRITARLFTLHIIFAYQFRCLLSLSSSLFSTSLLNSSSLHACNHEIILLKQKFFIQLESHKFHFKLTASVAVCDYDKIFDLDTWSATINSRSPRFLCSV